MSDSILSALKETSLTNFGLVIAFLIPGFTALWGIGYLSVTVRSWLGTTADAPTIGGFLYGTLASITAGLIVSTVRWALIDALHHATGVRPPKLDFARLQENVEAFNTLVEVHYRYYQFYANMLVALVLPYFAMRWQRPRGTIGVVGWEDIGFLVLELLFFAGSRDTLRKYYARLAPVLRETKTRLGRRTSRGRSSARIAIDDIGDQ